MDYELVPRNWTCHSCKSNATKRRSVVDVSNGTTWSRVFQQPAPINA